MKEIKALVVASVLAMPAATFAQSQPPQAQSPLPQSSITVAIGGLTCTTAAGAAAFAAQSWSWGASNSGSGDIGGGGSTGKPTITSLSVQKRFDACSPALLGALLTGVHFKTLTLTQQNGNGETVATVALEEVFVAGWTIGSSTADVAPIESLSIDASKVCITDVPSGNRFCYDAALGKVF